MAKLKAENAAKCVSILQSFIGQSPSEDKEKAILALEQLQKISAGIDAPGEGCSVDRPLIRGASEEFIFCLGRPRIDG